MADSAAPTDLSQLIDNAAPTIPNDIGSISTPVETASETVVAPTPVSNPVTTVENHKGFPKILLIVAAVVLLLVVGAAAYFFVFLPQRGQTGSVPAEQSTQQPLTNPPKAAVVEQVAPQPAPASTSSATFGNLAGSTQSAQPAATSSASAIELLRQRQQAAGR